LLKITVFEESSKDAKPFWDLLGGQGPIKTAKEGGDDNLVTKNEKFEKRLLEVSDSTGKLQMKEIAVGAAVKRSLLKSDEVYIFDDGAEVFAWIGKGTTPAEKKGALQFAHDYLVQFKRPIQTPICRILEGGENETFETAF